MSHFYASIQDTKNSGIEGHIRGWDIGAKIDCYVDKNGQDIVEVWITSGLNGYSPSNCLGMFINKDGALIKI